VAALALLTLLPAVRRGASYIEGHGLAWRWPYFPWSLFVILGVAAALRHYYLCLSFHTVPGVDSLFRPYFLVPPLAAVNLLFVEAALVSGRRMTRAVALAMPLALVALAGWHPATTYWQLLFLKDFSQVIGGEPLYMTFLIGVAIYALATARRLPGAVDFLTLSVAGLAVVRPTAHLVDLVRPEPLPILVCGLIQLLPALLHRSSPRLLAAASLVLAALTIEYRESWIYDGQGVVPWHLALAVVLVVGSLPNDRFAGIVQNLGAAMLCMSVVGWATWLAGPSARVVELSWSVALAYAYPLAVAALAMGYGRFVGNKGYYVAATVDVVVWSVVVGQRAYGQGRQILAGLDYLLLGAMSFLIAALISLLKTGLPQRWWTRHRA
jgi:hypothetical protein